jgi:hypothetical protein
MHPLGTRPQAKQIVRAPRLSAQPTVDRLSVCLARRDAGIDLAAGRVNGSSTSTLTPPADAGPAEPAAPASSVVTTSLSTMDEEESLEAKQCLFALKEGKRWHSLTPGALAQVSSLLQVWVAFWLFMNSNVGWKLFLGGDD